MKRLLVTLLAALLVLIAATGCQSAAPLNPTAAPSEAPASTDAPAVTDAPASTDVPAATDAPSEAPTATPAAAG